MRQMTVMLLALSVASLTQFTEAAQITGEYLEARTCNVYTGPCFANAELSLTGKEALMAWKVDKGTWNDVKLDGLGAALVLHAQGTLGFDGVFPMQAGKIKSVVLVDDKASKEQHDALVAFVKNSTKDLSKNVVNVERVPFELKNDHIEKLKNDFDILSVQRNLKILGIFVRLYKRDNKDNYLKFLPYTWTLIEKRLQNENVIFWE